MGNIILIFKFLKMEEEQEQKTCCCCIDINKGMYVLGIFTFLSGVNSLIVCCIQISQKDPIGLMINLGMAIPTFVLFYFYFIWFRGDSRYNRERVSMGFRFTWIYFACGFIVLFIVCLAVPSENIPGILGLEKGKLNESQMKKMKVALCVAIALVGGIVTWI